MSAVYSAAPRPTHRLVPSQFPPIGLFDTVATAADLQAVMELEGWTNDRLVADRIRRLPQSEWAFGRPNSSIVMAAFLHVAPTGMRFNGPDLGAWYAAAELRTAAIEVAHHLRREAAALCLAGLKRRYRAYTSTLDGSYVDIRGQQSTMPAVYDTRSYGASQAFGERLRAAGEAGIIFDSLRHAGGINVAAFCPTKILNVIQTSHYEISVQSGSSRIDVKQLTV
ncbi:RES family NAD+ phosphorylase [Methylobacterium isbiliense]|uniref:RES family NAD+ phosphorylase n=1 Tax=Methylobacterium isbiliense TaxID=315478 RepID=UPI001EE1A670|nr:RES family NAD+ phosphorylase [Methylobacterium isbiliense]MDN3626486.1 RES family NAD+ phosphorylase [Methylobacterium isbiliense]